jgi:hypothetical protein
MLDKHGSDKPVGFLVSPRGLLLILWNDYLTWSMEKDRPFTRDSEYLASFVLQINPAAIHTSSISMMSKSMKGLSLKTFTSALYSSPVHPGYADVLHEESFSAVKQDDGRNALWGLWREAIASHEKVLGSTQLR